jgi:beta-glucosidase/6-phospho-beta-glucosidase/beta-galactosidase
MLWGVAASACQIEGAYNEDGKGEGLATSLHSAETCLGAGLWRRL